MISTANKSSSLFGLLAAGFIFFITAAIYTEQLWLAILPFAVLAFYFAWQHKEMAFYLLLFALPLSFEYNFTFSLGTDVPDEMLMIVISILFFAYYCYKPVVLSKQVLQNPLFLLLIIGFTWMVLTVVFSTSPLISFKYLLAKGWYAGAFILAPLILFKEKKQLTHAAIALTASMMLVAILALVRHGQSAFTFASINEAIAPFFRNHVNYSAMLVCCIPILFTFRSLAKSKDQKFLVTGLILIALTALFFSYARGAWLALLVGLVATWLIRQQLMFKAFLIGISITILAFFWIKKDDRYLQYAHDYKTTIFHQDFSEHLIATYQLKDVSTAERFYRWIAGVRMIKDNWLTGYGPNTFYNNYKPYAIPAYKTWVSDNQDHSTVHNYFLLTTIEQGIPGLIFLLLLLSAMFYYVQYLYKRIDDLFYQRTVLCTGVILSMITVLNFLSDLIETDKVGSLFYLCFTVLVVADINTRKKSNPSPDVEGIPQSIT